MLGSYVARVIKQTQKTKNYLAWLTLIAISISLTEHLVLVVVVVVVVVFTSKAVPVSLFYPVPPRPS